MDTAPVELEGEIDVQVSDGVRERLLRAVQEADGTHEVVVDMGRVTFLDSSGLSALIAALKAGQPLGVEVRLVRVPDQLRRVFQVTGLTELFGLDR